MRQLLTDIVGRDGHQIVSADSAEKALEALPYWTFQVAFLDHNLPGMEGLVLGQFLRRNNPHMTIALVTGDSDARLPRRTREAGLRFVEKPFEPADIVRLLGEYIDDAARRHAARRQLSMEDYGPPFSDHADQLTGAFGIPKVPARVADRVVETVKRSLNNLRSVSRYSERDRVVALSGLLACKVMGIDLPRSRADRTLFEEYDALMEEHGRRPEFSEEPSHE